VSADLAATARRVRELAPAPEIAAAVRRFVVDRPTDLEPFLAGMLAALDPGSVLAKAREVSARAERMLAESQFRPAAEVRRPCQAALSRQSSREDVLWFCRERLGLREDGEDAHRTKFIGTYEDRTDEGDGVWIFFPRKPQADVRRKSQRGPAFKAWRATSISRRSKLKEAEARTPAAGAP